MTRLSPALNGPSRASLARQLAESVISAVRSSGICPLVVTSSDSVRQWAIRHGIETCADPNKGLSNAAQAGVVDVGESPWLVIHADLPFITPSAVAAVAAATEDSTVLVPSQDGGTTVIGGRGHFPFSYGIGSFHRHLALVPQARVIVSRALSVDMDTPRHLRTLRPVTRS